MTAAPDPAPAAPERCAEERRRADERCELATRARAQADAAVAALRSAQRAYDEHESAAVTASWRADPRADPRGEGHGPGGLPGGRRRLDRLRCPRDRGARLAERDQPDQHRGPRREREGGRRARRGGGHRARPSSASSLEADSARIGAETADAACLAARSAVADCDERAATAAGGRGGCGGRGSRRDARGRVHAARRGRDARAGAPGRHGAVHLPAPARRPPRDDHARRQPRRRRSRRPAPLAAPDDRRWSRRSSPTRSRRPPWSSRSIIRSGARSPRPRRATSARPCPRSAIASMASAAGSTSAIPSQRDLSLALGYAGLDPMRIRHWPTADETLELYREVTVAADEYLAGVGRRPDPGRDGDDAGAPGRWPGRGLEPVGPHPAAAARGGLTGRSPRGVSPGPRPRRHR